MIKATELRIGNWVNDPLAKGYNNPGPVQVESINRNGINEWQDMGASGLITFEEMEPIPLTPEWLKRCGFKRGGQHGDRNVFYPTGIHRINIELSGKDEYGYLLDGRLIKGHMRLKYLHQIQNLYFALCGIELEINPL